MYEHRSEPLLPRKLFYFRLLKHTAWALLIIIGSLGIGVIGYHVIEKMSWVDAIMNASMILGGMGPVNELHTTTGKLFASFYALFSGIAFLVITGTIVAPIAHRFLHHLHIDEESNDH
ncbi:MAG: hypothetical protein CVU46_13570 [Chloroflexi bacterium HGW-Chloroflexi-8]|jgi:hypothetical protein|nr:MAG: hypothetical protein CVU46_13570 [Chloroflexi bacterium HGW-Chloroflexi-8]